jgi:Tol biopolymer transport system component
MTKVGAVAVAALLVLTAAPAEAGSMTVRVSVALGATAGNDVSVEPDVSRNGRYVSFESDASDLVPDDHNNQRDVFVRDVVAGTTTRVSVGENGGDAAGRSSGASISAGGRYVAFTSTARNLAAGEDSGLDSDVFVRDLLRGTTVRASLTSTGHEPAYGCIDPAISANGRYVAFRSVARNLVPGDDNGTYDVFVRDLAAGTTELVSVATDGGAGSSGSWELSISDSGRYVSFGSWADNLVPGDGNNWYDAFVRDLATATTTRVSVDAGGGDAFRGGGSPSITGDGRYVAFVSRSHLVPGDGNELLDVYVRDLVAGTTVRASLDETGGDPESDVDDPSISDDGRFVAFYSWATDLVPGDESFSPHVYVRDLVAGTTTRVDVTPDGSAPSGTTRAPQISGDGRAVAYESESFDIAPPDDNAADEDVFLRILR